MTRKELRRRDFLALASAGSSLVFERAAAAAQARTRGLPRLKITGLEVYLCSTTKRPASFVTCKISTSEAGMYGVGDGSIFGRELAVAEVLNEYLKPMLIGRDPERIEDIWQSIFTGTFWRGGPILMSAQAAVDMALWDIKGKRAGMPVYDLLGGRCREGCLAYVPTGSVEHGRKLVEKGVKVLRVGPEKRAAPSPPYGDRISRSSGQRPMQSFDEEAYVAAAPKTIERFQKDLGGQVRYTIDVHERVSVDNAMRLLRSLEPFNVFFVEDVLRPERKQTFRVIRGHSTLPLAMGEIFNTKWEFLELITEQLIDYVRFDLTHGGGISEARKIAAIAEPYYVKTAWHGPVGYGFTTIAQSANLHVDLSVPNFGIQEHNFWDEELDEMFPHSITLNQGYLEVGDGPGLGCDINEHAVRRRPFVKRVLPDIRRPDGSVQPY